MELLSSDELAVRLGVTVSEVEQMIHDGVLFAVRFATGIKVLVDADDPSPMSSD
jgi:excisionase family DNA binding protein